MAERYFILIFFVTFCTNLEKGAKHFGAVKSGRIPVTVKGILTIKPLYRHCYLLAKAKARFSMARIRLG